jgi:hypothetical protein
MHEVVILYLASFWITGCRAENWDSVVMCPTNSTQSFAIYKLTIGLADYLNFKGLVYKKFSIPELVFFTYVLHRFVDKKHKKNSSNACYIGSWTKA